MLKSLFAFLSADVKPDLFQNFEAPKLLEKKSSKLGIRVAEGGYVLLFVEVFQCSSNTSGQRTKQESGKFNSVSLVLLNKALGSPLTGAASGERCHAVQLALPRVLAVLQLPFPGFEVSPALFSNSEKEKIELSPGL